MALFSKRIASKTLMITDHPDNPNLCYKWTKGGGKTTSLKGGRERYVCGGCRKMKDAKQVEKERKLPARILINDTWVDDGPTYQHFCEPLEKNKILGVEERRKMQAELAQGSRENLASARVRIETRVAQKYAQKGEGDRNEIRDSACGNSKATKQVFQLIFKILIDIERADILQFLATDYDEDQFLDAMSRYFGRIGHLIGFNPPQQAEVVEIMAEEEAEEEANASLDDNGILIEEVQEENENIPP